MSSRLDFEFEQVLGSWLDHCTESLSLQATTDNFEQTGEHINKEEKNEKAFTCQHHRAAER